MRQFIPTLTKFIPLSWIFQSRHSFQRINWRGVAGIIIGVGIIFRVVPYIYNRSIWFDEAMLALNIIDKSLSELREPLDYTQMAPLGFLFIEKILILTMGDSEYVLRLFPFLAGIISLFLFHAVARRILSLRGHLLALGLFAVSAPLIQYSSELKQYSSDVAIALGIYLLGLACIENKSKFVFLLFLFSITGSILIWFSHPAVFSLAGAGITLAYHCLKSQNWPRMAWLSMPAFFWLGSFAINFFIANLNLSHQPEMVQAWSKTTAFMPITRFSFDNLMWYPKEFFHMFHNPGGLPLRGLAAFCFIIGWRALFLEKQHVCIMLTAPFLFTLLASGLHLYPFHGRLILFLVPSMLIFISEGVERISALTYPKDRLVGVTLCLLFFFAALKISMPNVIAPESLEREAIRPVMIYLKQNYQQGDKVFLFYKSWAAFQYYVKHLGFEGIEYQRDKSTKYNWEDYSKEFKELKENSRVWILFAHTYNTSDIEENFLIYILDGIGKQIGSFKQKGASLYLYE